MRTSSVSCTSCVNLAVRSSRCLLKYILFTTHTHSLFLSLHRSHTHTHTHRGLWEIKEEQDSFLVSGGYERFFDEGLSRSHSSSSSLLHSHSLRSHIFIRLTRLLSLSPFLAPTFTSRVTTSLVFYRYYQLFIGCFFSPSFFSAPASHPHPLPLPLCRPLQG